MKKFHKLIILFTIGLSLILTNCEAHIKHAKTETYKVYGNCEMCKEKIEKASTQKHISKGIWDMDTKMLTLVYDSSKTSADALLRNIAYAGYDNDKYIAPDQAYNSLHACCQYTRKQYIHENKTVTKTETPKKEVPVIDSSMRVETVNPLIKVYEAYFSLKDALTKDEGTTAAAKANELYKAIEVIKMESMATQEHSVWMKYEIQLLADAEHIKNITKIESQRTYFVTLSANIYEVIKVIKPDYTVYFDHCPMYANGKGAEWLSKEIAIKNPYYGSQMIGCGKVNKTINK